MEIHFEIINKCLLGCRHCSSLASVNGQAMEYSPEDMTAFLNKLDGRKEVYLTGGEPLLHPEIFMLLKTLYTEVPNVVPGMFTSGIIENGAQVKGISRQYAEELSRSGLRSCYLSVYSCKEDEHDWMTGKKGSFACTQCSFENLFNTGIKVRFHTVMTAKNKNEIPELIEMAAKWGAEEVRLLKLIKHGRAEKCWDEIGITEEEYRQVVLAVAGQNYPVKISASGAADRIPCRAYCEKDECPAGKKLWYVTFQGDVYPCASTKNHPGYCMGNIREENIWKKCEAFRTKPENKAFCMKKQHYERSSHEAYRKN